MSDEQITKGGAERVLFVLATLARLERSVSIAELVAETGLAQSTLYRQLALLKRWGFVVDSNSEYMPGPMCLPLAWGVDPVRGKPLPLGRRKDSADAAGVLWAVSVASAAVRCTGG